MVDAEVIRREVQAIGASGALGRSRSYHRLLEYLAGCSIEGKTPKELEIAADVFGKGSGFDPSQDSLVRVYIHNLRQKLETYYAQADRSGGQRISIPKGEYRLAVVPLVAEAGGDRERASSRRNGMVAAAAIGLAAVMLVVVFRPGPDGDSSTAREVAQSLVWSKILNDDIPIVVVVGDYYIFGELDDSYNVKRLVREFSVNNANDLNELMMNQPELMGNYLDLDLGYLPIASAFALKDVLRIIHTSNKSVRVTTVSDLGAEDMKASHIVYIGYISALDKLMELVFASSVLVVGETFDELMNRETGEEYTSGAGIPASGPSNYHDYGLFSTFPGPSGNRFLILAGSRDEGLMHVGYALTDPAQLEVMQRQFGELESADTAAFEILYEVTGFDRMNLDGALVHSAELDYRHIWGGDLSEQSVLR